jgi:glycosyltransferase involved in cell wall biosynthesis
MPGVLRSEQLDRVYQGAGLLIAPSRTEAFGMVIGDARRRGLPVIAAETGGIPEAAAGGGCLFVPTDDPAALAAALRTWLTTQSVRDRLHAELAIARRDLPRWSHAVSIVERVLAA